LPECKNLEQVYAVPIISIQFGIRAKTPFDILGPMHPVVQDSIAAIGNLWNRHSAEVTKILEKDTKYIAEQFLEFIEEDDLKTFLQSISKDKTENSTIIH
jgi:hypothetical protein